MYLVISYDIQSDRRRTKIHKTLKNYGFWIQYSVFECDIEKKDYLRLRHELQQLIQPDDGDSLRFYLLCEECKAKIERIGGITPLENAAIFL
ncbi:MAG: CRISPR-associated endonuclease Cas2 [bacterium]|nr:CRISPR-associated endonuclease Cas2 [bacterium]